MKGYYICFGTTSAGVHKKIQMQMKELSTICETELLNVNVKSGRNVFSKILSLIPSMPMGFDYDELLEKIDDPCFLYIRRVTADCDLISFLKRVKSNYPMCKIIVECYTYPYDKDDFNRNFLFFLENLPHYLKDLRYRKEYKNCIDRFVTYSDDTTIFNVPTICTTNGVDVTNEQVPIRIEDDIIDLISVAHMQVHHGYERVLKGLYNYYKSGGKEKILMHMVGAGSEAPYYKKLVAEYELKDKVIFYGKKTGKDLEDIYNKADIALESFGLYKYNIKVISTLKMCEYLAKGFPVLTGCTPSMLAPSKPDFICEFSNNKNPVDINKVVDFYRKCRTEGASNLSLRIREFAMEYMDMPVVMKPIVEFLKS